MNYFSKNYFNSSWIKDFHNEIKNYVPTIFQISCEVENRYPQESPNKIKERTLDIVKRLLSFKDIVFLSSGVAQEEVYDISIDKVIRIIDKDWEFYSKHISESDREGYLFPREDLPKLPERTKLPIVYIKE